MDPGHDLAPDILVEGGAAVVLACGIIAQGLVVITACPDARGIVRGESHEPDVIVPGGRAGLARADHIIKM